MTKHQIARTVSAQYKVNVTDVRTSIRQGKEHRTGRRQIITRRPDIKKAYVRLQKGQTIDAFEVTAESEKK